MFTRITNSNLFQRLKDKNYRNQFIAGEVRRTIPFQLRALRGERKWTQADLGKEAEMPQTMVCRIENGDAASLSIKTLLKLASAFDVALVVRFEPIDSLIDWVDNLSPEVMAPRSSVDRLTEMEANAVTPSRDTASFVRALQAVSSTITANVQTTLAFDRPQAVPAGESVLAAATTLASVSAGTVSTDDRAA